MDDANLNNNIDQHTQAVDRSENEKAGHNAIMSDQVYLDPSRWWFASAAFPMIAGTLGPVASAFSICALVKNWRQHILPGSDVTKAVFIQDPSWLLAVNAVQLVIALVANVFLLLNMTKRMRFSIAQPVTITGWYISAICLLALCSTAGGPLEIEPEIEYVWSQAFYYGMYAAILYFIVASLMTVTVWGAQAGHYGKDFELTTSQRTLMLQTIMFLMYLLLGALAFSKIEGWNYLDAVYWADVTLFTVGFGDISPQTRLGRGLLVPYALVGVISLGLVIGSIRSMILDRGKNRLEARMLEKQRRQLIRRITQKGNGSVFDPIDDEGVDTPDINSAQSYRTEFERRQREFHLMRKIQRQASKKERWTAMAVSTTTWVVLWLVGAKIFQECEYPYQGWTYFDGFYFAFTALTTVGYGDLTPVSNSAKSFFVFWSLLALPTMTVLISNAGDTIIKSIKDGTLLLGNITILPGEHGFRKSTKQILAKFSCGVLFADDEEVEEDPPGFLGAARRRLDGDDDDDEDGPRRDAGKTSDADNLASNYRADEDAKEEDEPASSKRKSTGGGGSNASPSTPKSPGRAASIARESLPTELPKTRAEYHLVLIDEIQRVTQHLRHSPPRKYTFKEWAWYLRLIGEDESNADNHRRPEKRPPPQHRSSNNKNKSKSKSAKLNICTTGNDSDTCGRDSGNDDENNNNSAEISSSHSSTTTAAAQAPTASAEKGDKSNNNNNNLLTPSTTPSTTITKWSWVGHRSPLMDTREEAEWILDKLEQRLAEELRALVEDKSGRGALRQVNEEERQNEHCADPPGGRLLGKG